MDSSPVIRASYAACRRLSRRSGSNFRMAFWFLPRERRRAMAALHAFLWHSDDLVDHPRPGQSAAEALYAWRAALDDALGGASADAAPGVPGGELLPAVSHAVKRFAIPPEHLRAVLDGIEMDLTKRRYQTFDELRDYCEHVASAVGLACIHVWGFAGPEAFGPARSAGIAMQLTNILRDLKEDAAQGRIYLPLDDLRQCGYSVDELQAGVVNAGFARLMQLEIGRADEYYREGARLLDMLQPLGRRIFAVMMATYQSLWWQIRRRPADVFQRRVRLSRRKKLWIAVRWGAWPLKGPLSLRERARVRA
jgi:15-cis-phytoene synthase